MVFFIVDIEGDERTLMELFLNDSEDIAPTDMRLHFMHVSDTMGWYPLQTLQFDVLDLDAQVPALLVDDLDFRTHAYVDLPAGSHTIGSTPMTTRPQFGSTTSRRSAEA
ncbi:hypothetical protein G6O69_38640, partial [Pseudenhygromyxa sp. WMMC2535]|uniref:hypothetical protein n=1 Tax=Pseudenhygromyxa sp. WMMC2535 TaxID=2712867 RepID=UPI0015953497